MGPSEKAFQQVRNILGKLDRNIDQLRSQRTTPSAPPVPPAKAPEPRERLIGQEQRPVPGSSAGATTPPPTAARPTSQFGRATPIPPTPTK